MINEAWLCTQCEAVNVLNQATCYRCGRSRYEIHMQATLKEILERLQRIEENMVKRPHYGGGPG